MPQKEIKRVSIDLPPLLYKKLDELAKKNLTSKSVEGAKAVVDRLKEKKMIEDGDKHYL
jgi:metal-responsive CopG/Arc/MetJ family transcriptional regulator